jgi:hypothetical protein
LAGACRSLLECLRHSSLAEGPEDEAAVAAVVVDLVIVTAVEVAVVLALLDRAVSATREALAALATELWEALGIVVIGEDSAAVVATGEDSVAAVATEGGSAAVVATEEVWAAVVTVAIEVIEATAVEVSAIVLPGRRSPTSTSKMLV